ncbi:tape measure domain protein [Enterococcus mundtii]|uniref:Tape measure domain protein n=1 Tax=Enterococcus mundtii TaxID=53346 RepID=A0AAI8RB26_ENTMU|nr:tape measure protein [Enterococcus mundtii]BBM15587.1 tape measure domain protein [Enterococcus mundtii]
MEQYSVKAILSAIDSGFTSTMGGAKKSMSGLEDNTQKTNMSIMKMAAGAAVFKGLTIATNVLTASVGKAVDRYDTLNSYPRVLEQLGYSTMEADSSTRKLSEGINGLPTSLDEVVSTAQRLTILTGNLEDSTDLTIALNNAFLASGSSSAQASRGTEQYITMLSRGEVNLTSWRTLQETMGYALSETAKKMGIASGDANELYDALNDGLFTFDEFSAALIECSEQAGGFAEVALTASEGVRTSFENVKTSVVRNLANIIEAFDDMLVDVTGLNIAGHLNKLKDVVDTSMGAMTKVIKVFGSTLSTLLPIVKPLTPALVGMATAIAVSKVVSKANNAIAGYRITLAAFNATTLSTSSAVAAATAKKKAHTIATQHGISVTKARLAAGKLVTAGYAKETAGIKMITAVQSAYNAVKFRALADSRAGVAINALDMASAAAKIAVDKAKLAITVANTAASAAHSKAILAGTGATIASTAANIAFGKSLLLAMGPIGWVIGGVGALAGGLYTLVKRFGSGTEEGKKFKKELKDLSKATDKAVNSAQSNAEAHKENITQINASAGASQKLAKRVQDLANKENKSAGEKAQLKALTEQLNDAVPGLNAAYDEQADSLNLTEEAMSNYIETMKKQAEAQAYQDRLKQAIEDELTLREQRNALLVKQKEIEDDGNISLRERNKLEKEVAEQLGEVEGALTDATAATEYYGEVVAEAHEKAASAVEKSTEQARISFEDLSESQQAAVSTLIDRYDALAKGAQNAFEKMRHETEETTQSMLETLNHNATQTEKYGENLAKLHERAGKGSHENFTKWLDTMTEDNAAELAVLVQLTDEEMKQYEEALERGAAAGVSAASAETGLGFEEIAEKIGVFASEMPKTLREKMEAEMPGVGAAIPDGMKIGIEEGKEGCVDAAREMMNQLIQASKDEAGVNSPSRVYKEMGGHLIDGLVLGIDGKQSNGVTAMQKVLQAMQKAVDAESKSMAKSFDQIVTGADNSLSKLANVARKSMSDMESQFQSGSRTSQTTMRNLSNQLVQAFNRTPSQMQNIGRNIMNSLNIGLQSQQGRVQTTASQTHTRIIQAFNRTPSQMQSIGRNSMSNLNNGMRSTQGGAISTASNTNSRIVSTFNGLPSQLNQSGRNAMAGLTAGINAGAGGAIAAANRVANQVSATINKALDINSPSRVTKESGAFASEGLEVGLLSRINNVASAARRVSDTLLDNIVSGVDIAANLRVASPGKGLAESNIGKNQMFLNPIHIVNKMILDGEEIASSTNHILANDYDRLNYTAGGGIYD